MACAWGFMLKCYLKAKCRRTDTNGKKKVYIHRKLTYIVNGKWKMCGSEEFVTWKFTLLSNFPHVKRFEMEKCKTSYILASKCCSVSLYFHWKEKCRNSERMHVQLTWLWPFVKAFLSNRSFSPDGWEIFKEHNPLRYSM